MIELLPLAETPQLPFDSPTGPNHLRTAFDGLITMGAVAGAYRVLRRGVMGYLLPPAEQMRGFDPSAATATRDPRAVAVMALAYAAGVALTTAAVYLAASLPWALAWAGGWALLAAAVALLAAKDGSPIDDVRLLAAARAHDG